MEEDKNLTKNVKNNSAQKHPLFNYSKNLKIDYVFVIAGMAAVDGIISEEERVYIGQICDRIELNVSEKESIMERIRCSSEDIFDILKPILSSDIRFTLIWELITMEYADGVIMEEEAVYLKKIADYLQVTQKQIDIMIELFETGKKENSFLDFRERYADKLKDALIPGQYILF